MADEGKRPSFSPSRRWKTGFHVFVVLALVLSVLVMLNLLSREYFTRLNVSTHKTNPLSPRTVKFVESITNRVRVTVYYDKEEPLFSTVTELLNEYQLVNPKISVDIVDYVRDPGAAQELQTKYGFLASPRAKNLVIFDCEGRVKPVDGNELTKYVLEQVPNENQREFRRKPTAFEGEKAFTGTLIAVTSAKPLKAYFLKGHGEHDIDSADENMGYVKMAQVLRENYIHVEGLSLLGLSTVPMDCSLLVIAGPTEAVSEFELKKIEQYLNDGGRLLALFNVLSLTKGQTGLEQILGKWGVNVTTNVIRDPENTMLGTDVVVGRFARHSIVDPLIQSRLHVTLPREIGKQEARGVEGVRVEEIAFSGPKSHVSGAPAAPGRSYPLMVAVEKGAIKEVITERGTTRMVVIGDSIFLGNHQIDSAANRDFASFAVNWLLDRTELLEGVGPRPVITYRITMTAAQAQSARWLLLAAFPGLVLLVGGLVSFRRRR